MSGEHRIPYETIERIRQEARVEQVVGHFTPLKKRGASFSCDCAFCGKKDGLKISPAKQIAKCFSCGEAPDVFRIAVVATDCTFPEAVKMVAGIVGLTHLLDEVATAPEPPKSPAPKKAPKATAVRQNPKALTAGNFRDAQLRASGITDAMQRGKVHTGADGDAHWPDFDRYELATLDYRKGWDLVPGVDLVMHYVDLERRLMTFIPEKEGKGGEHMRQSGTKPRPMRRVRFQNPDAHNFDGKYASPSGSGQHLWLPNALIDLWEMPAARCRAFIVTEGEKKADRGAKAIQATAGIMGIHNLAKTHGPLPREFERLFDKLDTEDVVFFMDGDLFDLGSCTDGNVQFRPQVFASAVSKFRHHFDKLLVNGRKVRTHLAHPVNCDAKGLDDLLESGLISDEEYRQAIDRGILGHDHPYIKFYDLTQLDDFKIKKLWHLTDTKDFAEHYRDQIKEKSPERFRMGRLWYKFNEQDQLVLDQPMAEDEVFYTLEKNDRGKWVVHRDTVALRTFLKRRGFYRLIELDRSHSYVRVIDNVMERVVLADIRDYIFDFLSETVTGMEEKPVRNYFYDNHATHLSDNAFVTLEKFAPVKLRDQKHKKYFTFEDQVWDVSEEKVATVPLRDMPANVWNTQLVPGSPSYVGPLFRLRKIDQALVDATTGQWHGVYAANMGRYTIELTDQGYNCEFLKFLLNSSNFHWKKGHDLSVDEKFDIQQHLIAKITGMGHLMRKYRSRDSDYDIYAMEGNLIEGQRSEGGSGKSLIAQILMYVFPSIYFIDGKSNLENNNFLYAGVNEQTQFIWYDDFSKPNTIDFLYTKTASIGFPVRKMHRETMMIPYEDSPLAYITSNFNLLDNHGSTRRRFRTMAFSDYYSADHTPADEHGHLFWHDWGKEQMNLFFSLLADCCRAYLQCGGMMEAPSERVDRRRWLTEIGQQFCDWADATFLVPSQNNGQPLRTGIKVPKADAYGTMKDGRYTPDWSFRAQNQSIAKFYTEQKFKRNLWVWCLLRGHIINPGVKCTVGYLQNEFGTLDYGGDMKPGGVEVFVIVEKGQDIERGVYGQSEGD